MAELLWAVEFLRDLFWVLFYSPCRTQDPSVGLLTLKCVKPGECPCSRPDQDLQDLRKSRSGLNHPPNGRCCRCYRIWQTWIKMGPPSVMIPNPNHDLWPVGSVRQRQMFWNWDGWRIWREAAPSAGLTSKPRSLVHAGVNPPQTNTSWQVDPGLPSDYLMTLWCSSCTGWWARVSKISCWSPSRKPSTTAAARRSRSSSWWWSAWRRELW